MRGGLEWGGGAAQLVLLVFGHGAVNLGARGALLWCESMRALLIGKRRQRRARLEQVWFELCLAVVQCEVSVVVRVSARGRCTLASLVACTRVARMGQLWLSLGAPLALPGGFAVIFLSCVWVSLLLILLSPGQKVAWSARQSTG